MGGHLPGDDHERHRIHDRVGEAGNRVGGAGFFFNDTATTEIYTLSLHDALPISLSSSPRCSTSRSRSFSTPNQAWPTRSMRSEEHTSELQSLRHLVCRLLLE